MAKNPPSDRIVAAGSTGSIPATSEFLSCVAHLQNGSVILPGLDEKLSDDEWNNLSRSHPQGGLKKLLSAMDVRYQDVQSWHYKRDLYTDESTVSARQLLMRHIMAEDHGSSHWRERISVPQDVDSMQGALKNVSVCEADTAQDEALLIALKLRQVAEHTDQNAILVTPDRNLVRRVSALCTRWGIALDDSAGDMLRNHHLRFSCGRLLSLCVILITRFCC